MGLEEEWWTWAKVSVGEGGGLGGRERVRSKGGRRKADKLVYFPFSYFLDPEETKISLFKH